MPATNRAIAASATISFSVILLSDLQRSGSFPTTREWIGFLAAYMILAGLSDAGFEPAGGLALLIMVSIILVRGGPALAYVTKRTGGPARSPRRRRPEPRIPPPPSATINQHPMTAS